MLIIWNQFVTYAFAYLLIQIQMLNTLELELEL